MLSFFPLDVLDEIWDVIESGSEGFLTYSYIQNDFVAALTQAVYLISSWMAFVFFPNLFQFQRSTSYIQVLKRCSVPHLVPVQYHFQTKPGMNFFMLYMHCTECYTSLMVTGILPDT